MKCGAFVEYVPQMSDTFVASQSGVSTTCICKIDGETFQIRWKLFHQSHKLNSQPEGFRSALVNMKLIQVHSRNFVTSQIRFK